MLSHSGGRVSALVLVVIVCVGLCTLVAIAQSVPLLMNYQGRLTDAYGDPATGTRQMTFRLYTQATDGTAVWEETQTVSIGDNGVFNVLLGSVSALDASDFTGTTYLGVQVGSQGEMSPRRQVVSVAYALVAARADNSHDDDLSNNSISDLSDVSIAGVAANDVLMWNGTFWTPQACNSDDDDLSDNSIGDLGDVNTAGAAVNDLLTWSGSTWIPQAAPAVSAWSLLGNRGTDPTTNFLGTTDDVAFEVRVNDARALRIEPNSTCPSLIGGYSGNTVPAGVIGATIGGGGQSGEINQVNGSFGTVGGGGSNTASDMYATAGGGRSNTASGSYATVGGGYGNEASGSYATVGGGDYNKASGTNATVGGGWTNTAAGDYSFVAGFRANNTSGHDGVFMFADSINASFNSAAANEFAVRASGGYRLFSNSGLTAGVKLAAGASSWSTVSDVNLKENFTPLNGRAVLEQLSRIPIAEWNYRAQDESIRHVGPMAQDFYAAFGLGEDDLHISTVDTDGIALLSIQALYELMQEKDEEIEALEARLEALEEAVAQLLGS